MGSVISSKEIESYMWGDEKQKEILEDAIRSFDISRHANAPELDGNTKPLSAANIQIIDNITKNLKYFSET